MSCRLQQQQHATCRAWLRLLAASASSTPTPSRLTRPHRCGVRSLSSSAANDRPQPTATTPSIATTTATPPQQPTIPPRLPARPSSPPAPPTRSPPRTSNTLTPAILSQFHHTTPNQARTLLTQLLTTHSTTLTPHDYTTLIRLAHSLSPPPHTLVLTAYTAYTRRHPLWDAPAELLHFVLPVLYGADRHEEVVRVWEWVVRRGSVDQVVLGVVLRSCVVLQNGKLAWELFSKYRAPQHSTQEQEERMEQEAVEAEKAASSTPGGRPDRRREGAELARFVEESLFPHTAYRDANRTPFSSPTSAFNLLHYTAIVSALRYHPHHASQSLAVLWHMHTHRIRPDALFYNRLLGTLTTKALPHCSLYVLRDMEAQGMGVDGRVYYFVVTAHALRGRWEAVVRLVAEMGERGLDVNEHIYEAAVVCCAEAGLVERAKRIVAEMQHRAVPMTWRCYGALVTMAGQAGDWQWVLQLFDIARDRPDFRKQLHANDAVIEAVARAEERGEPTPLDMTAEQVYRRYFPAVIGPRGLWLLMRKRVEAERARGVLGCGSDVRELLIKATTPLTALHIGRMQLVTPEQEQSSNSSGSRRTTRRSRQNTLHMPSNALNEATASVDILLHCMLDQAVHRLPADSLSAPVDDECVRWREHLARLPACVDALQVIVPKDNIPPRERTMGRQLRNDPIYAQRDTDTDRGTDEVAAQSGDSKEDAVEAEAASEEQQREEDGEAEEEDAQDAQRASTAAAVDSDPAVEAVAEAESQDANEVEAPSIGHFVVNTVNSLLSLVSSRTTHTTSSALTGPPDEPSLPSDARTQRGQRLLSTVQHHLRSVYGIDARRTDDKSFHRLTLTSQQLTRWVERETEYRRARSNGNGHAVQPQRTGKQRLNGSPHGAGPQARWESGKNRAHRTDSVNAQADAAGQPAVQSATQTVVT